jgi:hypothetical protein
MYKVGPESFEEVRYTLLKKGGCVRKEVERTETRQEGTTTKKIKSPATGEVVSPQQTSSYQLLLQSRGSPLSIYPIL